MSQNITAEDLYLYTECDRKVYLRHHGDRTRALAPSPFQRWLMGRGAAHEAEIVGDFAENRVSYPPGDLAKGFALTVAAMATGQPRIYQGVLLHDDMVGIPDLLIRVDEPSDLGRWSYYPVDIKSASSVRKSYALQVMMYCHLLDEIQGLRPQVGGIIVKDGTEVVVPFDDELFDKALESVVSLAGGNEVQPFISSLCKECEWREVCMPLAEASQDASLLPGVQRRSWKVMQARGLGTLAAVAAASLDDLLAIPYLGEKKAKLLPLQAQALLSNEMLILQRPQLPTSPTEIYFDVESVPTLDLFYLMGTIIQHGDQREFIYDLATGPDEERAMWGTFLDRLSRTEGVIFHYANYEQQTIRKLDGRYGPDPRVPHLLERMVDIEKSIKQNLVLPLTSTSLKAVAPWLGFEWTGVTETADDSMVEYIKYLEDADTRRLDNILAYNEDDCLATLEIKDWLTTLQ